MTDWLLISFAALFCVLFSVAAFGIAMTLAMFLVPSMREERGEAPAAREIGVADLPRASAYGHPERVPTGLPDTSPTAPGGLEAPGRPQDGPRATRPTGRPCAPCKRIRAFLGL